VTFAWIGDVMARTVNSLQTAINMAVWHLELNEYDAALSVLMTCYCEDETGESDDDNIKLRRRTANGRDLRTDYQGRASEA
jgi:hypothetical protein